MKSKQSFLLEFKQSPIFDNNNCIIDCSDLKNNSVTNKSVQKSSKKDKTRKLINFNTNYKKEKLFKKVPLSPSSTTRIEAEAISFICNFCNYSTERISNLRRHTKAMHEESNGIATELRCCNEIFSDKATYRQHCRTIHKNGHKCEVCGRVFTRRALLRRHQSVHTGFKEFGCHLCSYATSHKSNLERHFKTHLNQHGSLSNNSRHSRYKPKVLSLSSPMSRSHNISTNNTAIRNIATNMIKKRGGGGLHPGTFTSTSNLIKNHGTAHSQNKKKSGPLQVSKTVTGDLKNVDQNLSSDNESSNSSSASDLSFSHDCPVLRTMLGFNNCTVTSRTSDFTGSTITPPISTKLEKPKLNHSIESILSRPIKKRNTHNFDFRRQALMKREKSTANDSNDDDEVLMSNLHETNVHSFDFSNNNESTRNVQYPCQQFLLPEWIPPFQQANIAGHTSTTTPPLVNNSTTIKTQESQEFKDLRFHTNYYPALYNSSSLMNFQDPTITSYTTPHHYYYNNNFYSYYNNNASPAGLPYSLYPNNSYYEQYYQNYYKSFFNADPELISKQVQEKSNEVKIGEPFLPFNNHAFEAPFNSSSSPSSTADLPQMLSSTGKQEGNLRFVKEQHELLHHDQIVIEKSVKSPSCKDIPGRLGHTDNLRSSSFTKIKSETQVVSSEESPTNPINLTIVSTNNDHHKRIPPKKRVRQSQNI